MDILELRNFLQSEGEVLTKTAVPTIDITRDTLEDILDEIQSQGLDYLIIHLETISNAFKTQNDFSCSPEVLAKAVEIICEGLDRLYLIITNAQGNIKGSLSNIDRTTKHQFRKYMAVLCFLIHQSFVEIEQAVTAEAHNISIQLAAQGTGRRKGKKQEDDERNSYSKFQFWGLWRSKIVYQLWKLMQPPMHEIWDGSVEIESHCMRCVMLALCTAIKNKAKQARVMDEEMENIFDILGLLAARYSDLKGIMARLTNLLKGSEETANMVACGIDRMIKCMPDQAQNIVLHALSETLVFYMERFKESGQERGFHAFLTQICYLQPKGAIHSLPVVVQFLESESQIVRNAVLVVAYELMKWSWGEMRAEESSQPDQDEDQGERASPRDNWLPLRQKLLNEILLHHMKDSNSFVRTKAINLLSDLVKNKMTVPAESVSIMKSVKLRLLDKTVTARKAATTLVIDLVKEYPHIVRPIEEYLRKREQKIQEIVSAIQSDENNPAVSLYFIIKEFHMHARMENFIVSPSIKNEVITPDVGLAIIENALKEGSYWKACEIMHFCVNKWSEVLEPVLHQLRREDNDSDEELYLRFFKATHPEVFPEDSNTLEIKELNYIAPKKVEDCREFLAYIQCCMKMQKELEACQPSLRKLLELGTTTDKKEAVMFYAAICEAGFKPSQSITVSIINALSQLNEEELKDFVDPFKFIFIGRENFGPVQTVKKLLILVRNLSESLVESLGGVIGELYRSHILTSESIKILWDAFCLSIGGWEGSDSRSAAYILGIIGQIERDVITSNLIKLIEVGLGERALSDFELAKVTLQTILYGCRVEQEFSEPEVPTSNKKKTTKTVGKSKSSEGIKFPPSHDLFSKIITLIEHGMKEEGNEVMDFMYPRVVELSIQIIYRMCTEPREVVMKFLPNIYGNIFSASLTASQQPQNIPNDPFKSSEKILFRYMSFGKALLGAHIMYYEQIVTKEIKHRKTVMDKSKKKSRTASRQRNSRTNGSSTSFSTTMNQSNNDAAASEMDVMIGNIGFDAEADNIKTYVSKLLDTGFFRCFRVHVLYLCQRFNDIKSLNLKLGVIQALAKLMLICEASVAKHIQYLVNLWAADEDFAVKLEILKASIRLTVKFPNQMEKLNDGFSSGLAHPDARVRKACMDYIQYLALSDLLKVREQLSDCAACLCDESFELREMAKDFINQIAEKDNVLQNCIPDIISRLSAREDVTQENFQIIMKTLLTKIKKEKQLGGLVDRIVGRFKGPMSVRVCQDTAFCLTQIQQNDKTLKILKDNVNVYADKLGDEYVWEFFQEVLGAIKKLNKPDLKTKIEEWEKDLEEHHAKCVALSNAERAAKRKNEKPQKVMDSESSSEEEEANEENQQRRRSNTSQANEENQRSRRSNISRANENQQSRRSNNSQANDENEGSEAEMDSGTEDQNDSGESENPDEKMESASETGSEDEQIEESEPGEEDD